MTETAILCGLRAESFKQYWTMGCSVSANTFSTYSNIKMSKVFCPGSHIKAPQPKKKYGGGHQNLNASYVYNSRKTVACK